MKALAVLLAVITAATVAEPVTEEEPLQITLTKEDQFLLAMVNLANRMGW